MVAIDISVLSSGSAAHDDAAAAFTPGTPQYAAKLARMQGATRTLLAGVGEDVTREGLLDTPLVRGARQLKARGVGWLCRHHDGAANLGKSHKHHHHFLHRLPVLHSQNYACKCICICSNIKTMEHITMQMQMQRVAKALLDQTAGYRQSTASVLGQALFHEPLLEEACNGMVLVRDIDFAALSEDR